MSDDPEREVNELADKLEAEADRLERHGNEVEGHIEDAREDWDRKRADGGIPGANPPTPEGTDFTEAENPASGEGGPVGGD